MKDLLAILHVLYALLEEGNDVLIFHTIIDFLALSARLDKLHLPQTAQVVRNRGFAGPDCFSQSANIQLAICQAARMRTRLVSLKARNNSTTRAAVGLSRRLDG